MTQEHGRVEPVSGLLDYSKYPLGSMLTLIPYHVSTVQCRVKLFCQFYRVHFHFISLSPSLCVVGLQSCATAMMHPVYHVHSEGRLLGKWTPTRGW